MSDSSWGDARRDPEPPTHPPISSGIVYTFIHEQFEGKSIVPREGAGEDFKNIEKCFTSLGLTVLSPYIDYSALEVLNVLREASLSNFEDYGCLVVIIITHYEEYGRLMTKKGCYYENEIIDIFKGDKCKGLVMKPKIFLLQSSECQELKTDSKPKGNTEADSSGEPVCFTLPTEADILALRSCYEGGPSHQPADSGSWVVQKLCERLQGLTGETPLEDALIGLLSEVAHNREKTNIASQSEYKYLPEITSTMTQPVYFKNSSLKSGHTQLELYKHYKKLGKVYIFNYNKVKSGRKFLSRDGTDIDADRLEECFDNLGFEVIRENDLTKLEVFTILASAKDFSEDTCVAVVVLTHAVDGNLGTFDLPFTEKELYKPFSDKLHSDLIGKPKFFFLQVCRGDTATGVVQVDKIPQERAESNLVMGLNEGYKKVTMNKDITTDASEIQFDGPDLCTNLGERNNIMIGNNMHECIQAHVNQMKATFPADAENVVTLAGSSVTPIQRDETNIIGGEERAMTTSDSIKEGRVETDAGPAVLMDAGKAIPQEAIKTVAYPLDEDDMLVFHSTYAGTPSHRNTVLGSWFIKNLYEVLQSKTKPFSFVQALSEVQKNVAFNEAATIANQTQKQMPVISSTLTKSLVVFPKPKQDILTNPINK